MPRIRPLLPRIDLRRRFVLVLVPIALGCTLAAGWSGRAILHDHIASELDGDLRTRLESRVLPLTARLHALHAQLRGVADHLGARSKAASDGWEIDAETLGPLRPFLERWPEVETVFIVRSEPGGRRVDLLDREGARTAHFTAGNGPAWVWFGEGVALPARFEPGRGAQKCAIEAAADSSAIFMRTDIVGRREPTVLGVVIRPEIFTNHVRPLSAQSGGLVRIEDLMGRVLVSAGSVALVSSPHRARLEDPSLGLRATLFYPPQRAYADLHRLERTMGSWILLAAVLTLAAIAWLTRRVVVPLERMSQTMEVVAAGDLSGRVPVEGSDEIARLSESFNTMIADLELTQGALRRQSSRLAEALQEVESVEAMKDSFLALVSHEVRTPLTSIMGGVEFLREEFGDKHDETETEFMNIVYESARRLAGFMNDAIMMASLQAQGSRISFEPFSMNTLVQGKIQAREEALRAKGLELRNFVPEQREFFVDGDWTLMAVAIEKLLDNACDHNVEGGRIEIELVDRVREEDPGDLGPLMAARGHELRNPEDQWRALRVFNTGPIIPPEKIDALFARFELTHDIDNHQRGSGLSLPIAHYVTEYHDGALLVRSVGDAGMAFYLVLGGRSSTQSRSSRPVMPAGVDETVAAARLLADAQREVEALEAEITLAEERAEARGETSAEAQGQPRRPIETSI